MPLKRIDHIHRRLLEFLAYLAAFCILFVLVVVICDVAYRSLGFGSIIWAGAASEYALLYTVTLASPLLVREKGHIMVESIVDLFPSNLRRFAEKFSCSLCLFLCIVLMYYFAISGWESYRWDEIDMRAINIPRWLMYLPFPIMFFLSAVEFARYLFGSERFFSGHGSKTDGI